MGVQYRCGVSSHLGFPLAEEGVVIPVLPTPPTLRQSDYVLSA